MPREITPQRLEFGTPIAGSNHKEFYRIRFVVSCRLDSQLSVLVEEEEEEEDKATTLPSNWKTALTLQEQVALISAKSAWPKGYSRPPWTKSRSNH